MTAQQTINGAHQLLAAAEKQLTEIQHLSRQSGRPKIGALYTPKPGHPLQTECDAVEVYATTDLHVVFRPANFVRSPATEQVIPGILSRFSFATAFDGEFDPPSVLHQGGREL